MRRPAQRTKPRIAKTQTFLAPISGWIRNQSLANPNARKPDGSVVNGAYTLENWFPTATGIRMRGGSSVHAVTADVVDIVSLFKYVNGNNRTMFASTVNSIFDVTLATAGGSLIYAGGDHIVTDTGDHLVFDGSTFSSAVVTGQSGGEWSVVQFATPGGTFLRAVNGLDTPEVYDGAAWAVTPAITGSGLTPENLSFVWAFQDRLFFVEKNTLNAWYLPAASIGGVAVVFPLGGVFNLGGSLLFGASWSLSTSQGGSLSEQCVFVSTEGEVAVYRGTDPSSASTFEKVGLYRIGKPRGPKAFIHAGGDIVIATDIGYIPLSLAVQRDAAALGPAAVSYPIEIAWNEAVAARSGDNWHCEIWPKQSAVFVTLPTGTGQTPQILVANARTGAWCLYTGWNATCVLTYEDRFFFGSTEGHIVEAEVTGYDNSSPYVATCVPLFDPLKAPASLKTAIQSRATIRSTRRMNVQLSAQKDYSLSLPTAPDDNSSGSGNVWGNAVWGQSVWSDAPVKQTFREWRSTPNSGYSLSIAMQITSGSLSAPDAELVALDMTYDQGDVGS